MRRLLPTLFSVPVAAVFALAGAPDADAYWKGPCIAGTKRPICYFWKGKVTFVADGDTIAVDVYGDGTSTPRRVRFIGINAMEHTVYSSDPARRRGECHALEATARLERLIRLGRRVVRLAAQAPQKNTGKRLRRSVAVKINGAWRDTGRILVAEGHALWDPNGIEWAWNSRYSVHSQQAAARGLRLWDRDYCGSGPRQATPLKMWVNWDADGIDGRNMNGEWVKIKNLGATDLPIGGWWFRDASPHRYTFPSGAVIPAGQTITLYAGSRPSGDTNTRTHFYWRRSSAIFQNVDPARGMGDGGFLFDRQGDTRAWMIYPCRYACADPLRRKIAITARGSAPETVYVRNTSDSSVDLEGYVVESPPYVYSFGPSTILDPGEELKLVVMGSPTRDSRLVKYWGKSTYVLGDRGDVVRLRTQTNVTIDCYAWGSASC